MIHQNNKVIISMLLMMISSTYQETFWEENLLKKDEEMLCFYICVFFWRPTTTTTSKTTTTTTKTTNGDYKRYLVPSTCRKMIVVMTLMDSKNLYRFGKRWLWWICSKCVSDSVLDFWCDRWKLWWLFGDATNDVSKDIPVLPSIRQNDPKSLQVSPFLLPFQNENPSISFVSWDLLRMRAFV